MITSPKCATTNRTRLLPSLALFGSFFLLGVFISSLGPAIAPLSHDLGVADVSLGAGVALRGLGYLLGSWLSSVQLPIGALNDRMARLGAATAGIGLLALAIDAAQTLWAVCALCFGQGFCGGSIDAIANAAISFVHGADVAPWMQGLHFCFSAGALLAPVAVGNMGYPAAFLVFGLLALPTGVACCLTSSATAAAAAATTSAVSTVQGVDGGGKHHLLVDEGLLSMPDDQQEEEGGGGLPAATLSSGGDVEMVQATGPRSLGASGTGTGGDPPFSHRHPNDEGIERDDSPPAARRRSEVHSGGGRGGALATRRKEEEEDDAGGEQEALAEHGRARSLLLSREEVDRQPISAAEGQPIDGQSSAEEGEQPLRLEEHETGGKPPPPLPPPPFPLVGLLVLFFFLYVGIEVGFGAWVAVVVLRDDLAGQAGAALMASVFWGGITLGRLLAIPLAIPFSAGVLLTVNLVGGLLSSTLLWFIGRDGVVWAAMGAAGFGLTMASTYPLAMSLLPEAGYALSEKNSSRFVVGGALGEMLVPACIALLLGPSSSSGNSIGDGDGEPGRSDALYGACFAVLLLLVAVYGTWSSLLASSAATAAASSSPLR
ncbi:unnamed protein product [Ectocarpus sp. 4 AP-2014]